MPPHGFGRRILALSAATSTSTWSPSMPGNTAVLVHQTSRGYPRAVNNLALQALIAAFAADKAIVDESSTRTAIAEVTAD